MQYVYTLVVCLSQLVMTPSLAYPTAVNDIHLQLKHAIHETQANFIESELSAYHWSGMHLTTPLGGTVHHYQGHETTFRWGVYFHHKPTHFENHCPYLRRCDYHVGSLTLHLHFGCLSPLLNITQSSTLSIEMDATHQLTCTIQPAPEQPTSRLPL